MLKIKVIVVEFGNVVGWNDDIRCVRIEFENVEGSEESLVERSCEMVVWRWGEGEEVDGWRGFSVDDGIVGVVCDGRDGNGEESSYCDSWWELMNMRVIIGR